MQNIFPLAPLPTNALNIFQHKSLREASIWELVKDLIRPKPRPLDCLQVEITSHCAAKCTYCPHTTDAATWQAQHMQPHTFANLWPLLQQSTRVHLQGWGEPLLHPYFFDFVALARKAGCLVSSTSCAMHLSEKKVKKILESGIDILAFSLAGTDAQSNAVRAGADFHTVCDNITLLQKLRKEHWAVHLEIHVAYLLLADRMEAILALPKLLHDLGVPTAIISTLDYAPSAAQAALALTASATPASQEKLARAQKLLQQAREEAHNYGIAFHYALPSATMASTCRENIQKSLYISATGHVSPCVYLQVPSQQSMQEACIFGNVNEENAAGIWEKDDFVRFRQDHAAGHPSTPLCLHCVKRYEVAQS